MNDHWLKMFGLTDKILYLGKCGNNPCKVFLSIGFSQSFVKVFCISGSQFFDSVYSGSLKQFSKQTCNAIDSEQVSQIDLV